MFFFSLLAVTPCQHPGLHLNPFPYTLLVLVVAGVPNNGEREICLRANHDKRSRVLGGVQRVRPPAISLEHRPHPLPNPP